MNRLCLTGGRVIDPSQNLDMEADVFIEDGKIEGIYEQGTSPRGNDVEVIDVGGKWVVPGLIDVHVHLREPGFEYKEDIASGCEAAAAGGFTTICCMPNTNPVIDCVEVAEYVKEKAAKANGVRVLAAACITKMQKGQELTDMASLKAAGICGFSEDGRSVSDLLKMREAMELAKSIGMPIFDHTEQEELSKGGFMNSGKFAELAGIPGIPPEAEEMMAIRDILLAKETGCRLHLSHISTLGSLDLIRAAKSWGISVTAETAPHYFTLSDGDVIYKEDDALYADEEAVHSGGGEDRNVASDASLPYNVVKSPAGMLVNTHRKMNPPLRTKRDEYAMITALIDGTIDAIATDHAPHSRDEKSRTFDKAPFGVIGLETSFAVSYTRLVEKKFITPMRLISLMSTNPAKILGCRGGTLQEGREADIAVIDTHDSWQIPAAGFCSKAENTAFAGMKVRGRVMMTIVNGKIIYKEK